MKLGEDHGVGVSSVAMSSSEKALSTSGVDPTGEKGLSEIIIVQNKPKKSMSSPVAPEGIDIFSLMD